MVSPPTSTVAPSVRRPSHLLLPREHGAYGQLLFPLATALVLGNRAPAAFGMAIGCAAAFVGHEAVLTLLGQRGPRALREHRRAAVLWLVACGATALVAVAWSFGRVTSAARVSLLGPVLFVILLAPFVRSRREHSAAGETVAAVGLASCGVPVALAGGVSWGRALACWLVFALSFVVATVAVRSIIARVRNAQAGPGSGRPPGWQAATLAAGVIVLSSVFTARGWMPPGAPFALAPVCGLAGVLALFPPHPRHLRAVGWGLVTATAMTAAVLATGR